MSLKYILKKNLNIKNGYLIAIMIAVILVIGGCFSYAIFTASNESKGALNIITGNLYPYIGSDSLDSDKEIVLAPNEVKFISLKLSNINTIDAKVNLYYSLSEASDKVQVNYLSTGDVPPTNVGYVLSKSGTGSDTKTIDLRIVNNDTKNIGVKFGSDVGLSTADLSFPGDKNVLSPLNTNGNIISAYTYNDGIAENTSATKCITGEEETCQVTNCYENSDASSCPVGTIVKYRVNDTDIKYFYVLHDDGDTITLQQRENIVYNTAWYLENKDSTKGPLTILPALEEATKNWDNVNDQTYTLGTTNFNNTNAYTGCTASNGESLTCSANIYTLAERVAKARMITAQEVTNLGCKYGTAKSCPIWIYNYLSDSVANGGTNDDKEGAANQAYWITSASSTSTLAAFSINQLGAINDHTISDATYGARAVIQINKK